MDKRSQIDSGTRSGIPTEERERIKALEWENKELHRANEILKTASAFFAQAELEHQLKKQMPTLISIEICTGVELIRKALQVARSGISKSDYRNMAQALQCSQSHSNLEYNTPLEFVSEWKSALTTGAAVLR